MRIDADRIKNQVILTSEAGTQIILSWAGAANLASLLNEASRQAEPPAPQGKTYRPAVERSR